MDRAMETNLTGRLTIHIDEAAEILLRRSGDIPKGIKSGPRRVTVTAEGPVAAELLRLAADLDKRRTQES